MNAIGFEMGGAALQHNRETIGHTVRQLLWVEQPTWPAPVASPPKMIAAKPRQLLIKGITPDGRTFRPSDWSERLAGAMSSFRPDGVKGGIGTFIGYSPYCVPRTVDGVKCVIVSEALRGIEPMAWDFVTNFARDNQLQVADADPNLGMADS